MLIDLAPRAKFAVVRLVAAPRTLGDTRRMRKACWLSLATLLVAAPAIAQKDPAHDHYLAGAADYKAGRYAEAIGEFQIADQLRPSPVLSFDIAQCYEKMADLGNARTAYQQYLKRAPNAPDRAAVEATIASIDKRLQEKGNDSVVLVPSSQLSQSQENKQAYWLSGTLIGVGAAGIIAGIVLNSISSGNASSLTDGTLHRQSDAQGYYDTASNTWTAAVVSYSVGGGLLAVGTALLTYQLLQKPQPAAAVTLP
jgi:tetratricopeptide (TPR) repeat protein